MVPELGETEPAMMLKSVVFPAPLGPINPQIWPSSTSKLTSFNAASPAKYLVRRSTDRSGGTLPPYSLNKPAQPAQPSCYAPRLKENDHDQKRAVQKKMELRKRRDQFLLHQSINKTADHRPSHGARPADDGHQQNGHAGVEPKHSLRVDVRRIAGVHTSGDACQCGGQQMHHQLGLSGFTPMSAAASSSSRTACSESPNFDSWIHAEITTATAENPSAV